MDALCFLLFFEGACCVLLSLCVYWMKDLMEEPQFDNELIRLRDRMYRFARSLLGSSAEAEDATQDVLERLWRRRVELSLCRNFEAFVMTALRNGCIDRLRRRKVGVELNERVVTPQDNAEGWSNREWVRLAMARLPLKQREVLHLKEIEGYSIREIAELYGMEENQVRVVLSRGRRALREELEKLS